MFHAGRAGSLQINPPCDGLLSKRLAGFRGGAKVAGLVSGQKFNELAGLHVTVDKVRFNPFAGAPADRPHCFVYFITIHNDSNSTVTIKGRKWVVANERGEITAVEADGVVGQFPRLSPGEKFSYNSFHLLETRKGAAEGAYIGVTDDGETVIARIPRFEMIVPPSA